MDERKETAMQKEREIEREMRGRERDRDSLGRREPESGTEREGAGGRETNKTNREREITG